MTPTRGNLVVVKPETAVDLSVLVPVYNNASTLDELLDRLLAVLEPLRLSFEIVLVDDGSTDSSLSILRARAARDARIRVFALVRNFGSQAASCAACDQARGRRIVHIDADLENLPEDIPRLLERMDKGFDLVCGYREERRGSVLTRRWPSRLVNAYVRYRTQTPIRDVGCGLRAFEARLIENLTEEGEARRLMTPVLLRRACRLAQVPVRYRPKGSRGGHSFFSLLAIASDYYMVSARRPFLVSGFLASAAVVVGVIMVGAGLLFAGLIVGITAVLGAGLSLLGEHLHRIYQLVQRRPFYELRRLED